MIQLHSVLLEVRTQNYLPAGAFATPAVESEGGVKISAASLAGAAPDADGTLATVTFEVVEAKASMIGIANVILAGANNAEIEATTMDGMVTVGGVGPVAEEEAAEEEAAEEPAAEEEVAEEEVAEEPAAEETPSEEAAPEMPVSQMFEITLTNLTTGEHGVSGQTFSPRDLRSPPRGCKDR